MFRKKGSLKKAQAAMEFLMTYGWAILVVLVVISALAYFGVFNVANLLPERCTFPVTLACVDHRVDGGNNKITLQLQNGGGRGMNITNITVTGDGVSSTCQNNTVRSLQNGEQGTFVISSCTIADIGRPKNRYQVDVAFTWLGSSLEHTLTGELLAKTENP